ncbi:RNA polymerase sigma factor [Stieleria varia]|uniref:ECF RNA polymerase sigma-E factor n=1 Tax=Stieleria varia TaxID=2528005 RepID=A0A5C6AZ58_9BACT|nr:sigma-70 family RNA polymerase sigma factor [Stieleria varia]TWU04276.1 ECF RNA polymerase sigma-E factor [Stieleria varia]
MIQSSEKAQLITLLYEARSGDADARHELLLRMRMYIGSLAKRDFPRRLSAKLDASDIIQQSMVEADLGLKDFDGRSNAELHAWLERLVKRNLIDAKRCFADAGKRTLTREVPLGSVNEASPGICHSLTASRVLRRREVDRELENAIARLPDRRRTVVELRHRHQLSYAEIATRMGMTEVAARKLWSRSLEQLRSLLNQSSDQQRPPE